MTATVTIMDVAQMAGVSTATVSRVLNEDPCVTPETQYRVEQAIVDLRYRPSNIARSMARGRTASVALVLDDLSNPFNAQAAEVVMGAAERRGFRAILGLTGSAHGSIESAIEFLVRQRVDGFIFGQVRLEEPSVEALLTEGSPVVLFNRRLRRSGVPFVGIDNYGGGVAVARHLIGLGHKQMAVIAGPPTLSTVTERVAGYRAACEAAGVSPGQVVYTAYRPGEAHREMADLLGSTKGMTAVFATSDFMALEAIECAASRGVHVPGDMAVVGFDDIELASHPWIRLTTVAQRVNEQASRAADRLLDIIAAKRGIPETELLPADLIIRRTCGTGH